jgi:pimeloyl-ACP methyl ester carboxylesterase
VDSSNSPRVDNDEVRRGSRSTSGSRWRRRTLRLATAAAAVILLVTVAATAYDLTPGDSVPPPPLDAAGHVADVAGLRTHYEQWGSAGSSIVLVHGFLESASVWGEVGPRLAALGHRVFAIDVRGYGYTQRRGPYTLASDTDQLAGFLSAAGLVSDPTALPVLIGHSSGAAIVGNLARLRPADVGGIVFMDGDGTPYGVGPAWVHRLLIDPYATAVVRLAIRHPGVMKGAYESACGPRCPPFDAAMWTRPFRTAGGVDALTQILRQQLIGLTYRQERQIHVPAAVLYGSADSEMTDAQAKATAARLHTTRVVAIPGAGHLGMLSDPASTAADISALATDTALGPAR